MQSQKWIARSLILNWLVKRIPLQTSFLVRNLKPETRIGICSSQISGLVVSILGVIQARCVFVPLNSSLPKERLNSIIEQSRLDAIIISGDDLLIREWSTSRILILEELLEKDTYKRSLVSYPDYQEDDSLYIFFTSGSTGIPKGIVGKNSSLWHFIRWEIETFEIKEGARFSQLISPNFDAFMRDIFVPLMSGGTICVPPNWEKGYTPEQLQEWIEDQDINFIHCVPSVFRLMNSNLTPEKYKSLKLILLSGERIVPAELGPWYTTFGERIGLVNMYGSTEATMISSYYKIQIEDSLLQRIPIGEPISNAQLLILDKNFEAL